MDETVKNNKGGKRRGAPAPEPGKTTATVAGAHGGDAPAANEPAPGKPAPARESGAASQPAPAPASGSAKKARLVRASFALPRMDHAMLAELKAACRQDGAAVKKSQLLRVAIGLLRELDRGALAQLVQALPPTKNARKGK
jgi:hypothetical protein